MSSLRDKQIILAGGAGGIGRVIAAQLQAEGAHTIVSYRRDPRGIPGAVPADLTVAADRARLLDLAPQLYGLVILAGDPARLPAPEDALRASHDANYLGPVLLAREAAGRMKASETPGAIVLFGTMQAVSLFPGSTAYAAQKAALTHAAKILAREYRGASNIRVNVVSPGITAAGMAEASIAAGKYDRYLEDGTLARFGRPADVARVVRLFLEPDSYITGQVLSVDGGITL